MLAQALPRVKADAGDLDARMDCQIGTWLSTGPLASGVPMGASHGIGYVLGAEFGVPHGYTSCVMLPSVMRWNKSANAERQALVAAAMGHPGEDAGDVLDDFIRGLGMPRSLREVKVGPEHFDRIAQAGDGDALGAAQPAQDRGTGAGARNSGYGRVRRPKPTCTPASMLIFVRFSPPSSWRHRRNRHLSRAGGALQPAGASVSQPRPEAARPLFDLHGEQQPLPRSLRRRRTRAASITPA